MNLYLKLLVLFCWCSKTKEEVFVDIENLNMTEIIAAYGYPIEVHTIVTDDGYILVNYRVPYGRNSTTKKTNKYPVILHHGLFSSAECFVYGPPDKAYAYYLADRGFDVWLMNDRGTWHSRKHQRLDPDKDYEFWKFTFHEIGIYDTRNTIDYILDLTKMEKLFYIGHSQGGTTGLVLLSEYPEYNQKIILYEGLAAGAYYSHANHPLFKLAVPMRDFLQKLGESLKLYEVFPKGLLSNDDVRTFGKALCGKHGVLEKVQCKWVVGFLTMLTPDDQLNPDAVPMISSTGIGGASLYQGIHFLQLAFSGKFTQYDWGPIKNLKKYGSSTPPEYDLSKITCPVALMYGLKDSLARPEDVKRLSRNLKTVVDLYEVPHKTWTHLDFLWAKDLDRLVLNHIVELFYKYVE